MADHEVEVNGKTYGEDTKVTLKVKTVAWIVGILISVITTLATMGYLDMKSDIEDQKEVFEKEKQEYKEEIKNMLQKELKGEVDKRELMYKDIYDIKGDIKVILDRTSGHNSNMNVLTSPESIPLPK